MKKFSVGNSEAVKLALGRELTQDECAILATFREEHGVTDDDPMVKLVDLVGMNLLIARVLPEQMRKVSNEITEAHVTHLRGESNLFSKELVTLITNEVMRSRRLDNLSVWRWKEMIAGTVTGVVIATVVTVLVTKYFH